MLSPRNGATLFHMLTGREPFEGPRELLVVMAEASDDRGLEESP